MLDHIFLTVTDLPVSIAFYTTALAPLGIVDRLDYDGRQGPAGHRDLTGFGAGGRMRFWLRQGPTGGTSAHVGFTADSNAKVDAAYRAAMHAGATSIHPPGPQPHYDPRYYAAQVRDPDGYSLEFVHKPWQHGA